MIDVVVWEAVIGGPGLCVPWQHCFSSDSNEDFSGILQNEADVLTCCI
jgi:hypothetical protein